MKFDVSSESGLSNQWFYLSKFCVMVRFRKFCVMVLKISEFCVMVLKISKFV